MYDLICKNIRPYLEDPWSGPICYLDDVSHGFFVLFISWINFEGFLVNQNSIAVSAHEFQCCSFASVTLEEKGIQTAERQVGHLLEMFEISVMFLHHASKNKAGYMATLVACEWAGAVKKS